MQRTASERREREEHGDVMENERCCIVAGVGSIRGQLAGQVHVTFITQNDTAVNNINNNSSDSSSTINNNSSHQTGGRHCYVVCVKGTLYFFSHKNLQNNIVFRTFSCDTLEVSCWSCFFFKAETVPDTAFFRSLGRGADSRWWWHCSTAGLCDTGGCCLRRI